MKELAITLAVASIVASVAIAIAINDDAQFWWAWGFTMACYVASLISVYCSVVIEDDAK